MPMPRGAEAYRRVEAESRSPMELVVMLYDGALRFLAAAREAHGRRDLIARGNALSRALAIIAELQSTLNLKEGGAIAAELDRLYSYITWRLMDVNVKQDGTALDEAHKLLSTLSDAWAQTANRVPQGAA
ncbi:MAG TPA: flagellar export chaperone FliS [Vicinamibacterales bacterium]|nr:flagellar export chaperone FliS [Vicinamibacterales bacterium]